MLFPCSWRRCGSKILQHMQFDNALFELISVDDRLLFDDGRFYVMPSSLVLERGQFGFLL